MYIYIQFLSCFLICIPLTRISVLYTTITTQLLRIPPHAVCHLYFCHCNNVILLPLTRIGSLLWPDTPPTDYTFKLETFGLPKLRISSHHGSNSFVRRVLSTLRHLGRRNHYQLTQHALKLCLSLARDYRQICLARPTNTGHTSSALTIRYYNLTYCRVIIVVFILTYLRINSSVSSTF